MNLERSGPTAIEKESAPLGATTTEALLDAARPLAERLVAAWKVDLERRRESAEPTPDEQHAAWLEAATSPPPEWDDDRTRLPDDMALRVRLDEAGVADQVAGAIAHLLVAPETVAATAAAPSKREPTPIGKLSRSDLTFVDAALVRILRGRSWIKLGELLSALKDDEAAGSLCRGWTLSAFEATFLRRKRKGGGTYPPKFTRAKAMWDDLQTTPRVSAACRRRVGGM